LDDPRKSTTALTPALFISAAILIVAAAAFHANSQTNVAETGNTYRPLPPLLGLRTAWTLFAVALLASALNSTVTATPAGQIIMEGFLEMRIPNWAWRLITRAIAIVQMTIATAIYVREGYRATAHVERSDFVDAVLFAVLPLVRFVSDRKQMVLWRLSPWRWGWHGWWRV
jgi:manganese transport protein